MPRLKKSEENGATDIVKRVSRPRTARAPETIEAPLKRSTRSKYLLDEENIVTPQRKAPTPIAANIQYKKKSNRTLIGAIAMCIVMFSAGVAIGFSDKGAIDVVAMVNERNEKVTRGEVRDDTTGDTVTQTVPVQNIDQRPNGGLRPASEIDTPTVSPVNEIQAATSTASTSETVVETEQVENNEETESEVPVPTLDETTSVELEGF